MNRGPGWSGLLLGFAGALVLLVGGWAVLSATDEGPPTYERRDGPRLAGLGRPGLLEYAHSISLSVCLADRSDPKLAGRIRADARRDMRQFERLASRFPDRLIKTKIAYSDYGDVPQDMTLREYAKQSAETLEGDSGDPDGGSRTRECRGRYRARFLQVAN